MKTSSVFISYSHKDKSWADVLFENSIQTTRDITIESIDFRSLVPGDQFDQVLRDRIQQARGFILLVSKKFLASKYVQQKEWLWIRESSARSRICCIEIGSVFDGAAATEDDEILDYLKDIHREVRLPTNVPASPERRAVYVRQVQQALSRMLDPEGMEVAAKLASRNLQNIQWCAEGTLANVYSADTPTFGRKLAVKVPRKGLEDTFLAYFHTANELSGIPNFVPVYEIDTQKQPFHCITEFIVGMTLAQKIAENEKNNRAFDTDKARYVLLRLSLALNAAHRRNMPHLNIRPSNILIERNYEPFLLPGGRSREHIASSLDELDEDASCYVLPEQVRGESWTEESVDIHCLGVIAYRMLTNTMPGLIENFEQVKANPDIRPVFVLPRSVNELNHECPVTLGQTIMRMLSPEPSLRYDHFQDVIDALMLFPFEDLATAELSWRRCLHSGGEEFFGLFYQRFFDLAGESVVQRFPKPWPTARQINLLRDAVLALFQFYNLHRRYHDVPSTINPLYGLATEHARRNISEREFKLFAEALIDTVVSCDPKTDDDSERNRIRRAWREVVIPGTDYLERHVKELTGGAHA